MDTLRANIKTRLRADERDDMAVTEDDIRKT
jgi:hypothetical protein